MKKLSDLDHAIELKKLKAQLAKTKDAKTYRQLLARIGGKSGRGSLKRLAALRKANEVRWGRINGATV